MVYGASMATTVIGTFDVPSRLLFMIRTTMIDTNLRRIHSNKRRMDDNNTDMMHIYGISNRYI